MSSHLRAILRAIFRPCLLAIACLLPAAALHSQTTPSFDSSSGVLSLPVVDVPGTGIVNAKLGLSNQNPIQFTLQSATVYATPVTVDGTSARVLNGSTLYIPRVQVGNELYELNLGLVSGDPIIFGNLQVVSVTPVAAPTPTPAPTPAPTPSGLQSSIARGQTQYASQCANCHGSTGNGGALGPSVVSGGFGTFATLRTRIHNTMPQGNPNACADLGSSTCATDVANYIINVLR